MSDEAQCDPTEQTLYEEPHPDHLGAFNDRLFRCGTDGNAGIGICVGGTCHVRPLKEWMWLSELAQAADTLAKAVSKDKQHDCWDASYCRLCQSLAAYEKVRGTK